MAAPSSYLRGLHPRCPECGSRSVSIEASATLLYHHGRLLRHDVQVDATPTSAAECDDCGHEACIRDFAAAVPR